MCNRYAITDSQHAIRELSRAMVDRTGNLASMPGVFPDYSAPIVRNGPDGRELALARGACRRPPLRLRAARPIPASPMSGMSHLLIGGVGLALSIAASCPSPVSPRTKPCRAARTRRSGSRSVRTAHSPSSPGFGPPGPLSARSGKARRPTISSPSSPLNPMPWSRRSIRRPCP